MAMHATYCTSVIYALCCCSASLDCMCHSKCNPPFIFILLTSDHETDHNGTSTKELENVTVLSPTVHMPEADCCDWFEETAQGTKRL